VSEEKTKETEEEQSKPSQNKTEKDHSDVDYTLQVFTHLANAYGMSFFVTLSVGGSLISGRIISRDEYMKSLTDSLREDISKWRDEAKEFLESRIFEPMTRPLDKEGEGYEVKKTQYIHLKDARVFNTAGRPIPSGADGFLWRGRISSVDGFSMGKLEYRG
jgi:hypothetical protein